MEIIGGHDNKINVFIYEVMGTTILMLTINMSMDIAGGKF